MIRRWCNWQMDGGAFRKLAERKGEKRFWTAVNKAVKRMASDRRVKEAVCG